MLAVSLNRAGHVVQTADMASLASFIGYQLAMSQGSLLLRLRDLHVLQKCEHFYALHMVSTTQAAKRSSRNIYPPINVVKAAPANEIEGTDNFPPVQKVYWCTTALTHLHVG